MKIINSKKQTNLIIPIIILGFIFLTISCNKEEKNECETETICYGDGNCIEKPIPGTCFD